MFVAKAPAGGVPSGPHTGLFTALSVMALPGGRRVFSPKTAIAAPPTPPAIDISRPQSGGGILWPKRYPLHDDAPAPVEGALFYAQPPPLLWVAGKIVNKVWGKGVVSVPQIVCLRGEIVGAVGGRAVGRSGASCRGSGTVVAIGDDDIERLMALLL